MPRGRDIPSLQQAWHLKGKLMVKLHRGAVVVQTWPKPYGPPRSQAQADTITAFKQMQRAMKFAMPQEWVSAIEDTKQSGMYPRDYLFSAMSGNMMLVESYLSGAISAAIDRLQSFTANGGETTLTFNGIPPGYRSIELVGQTRLGVAATFSDITMTLNTDISNSYDGSFWNADGTFTSIAAQFVNVAEITANTAPANYASSWGALFPNYAGAIFYKSIAAWSKRFESAASVGMRQTFINGWWRKTAPITRIDLAFPGGAVKGSTVDLYGRY